MFSVETAPKLDSEKTKTGVCIGIYSAFKGFACRRGGDHICIYIYVYVYVYISVCVCVEVSVCMYIYTYIQYRNVDSMLALDKPSRLPEFVLCRASKHFSPFHPQAVCLQNGLCTSLYKSPADGPSHKDPSGLAGSCSSCGRSRFTSGTEGFEQLPFTNRSCAIRDLVP